MRGLLLRWQCSGTMVRWASFGWLRVGTSSVTTALHVKAPGGTLGLYTSTQHAASTEMCCSAFLLVRGMVVLFRFLCFGAVPVEQPK